MKQMFKKGEKKFKKKNKTKELVKNKLHFFAVSVVNSFAPFSCFLYARLCAVL